MNSATPEFSVVIACFREAKSIQEFHVRLSATLKAMSRTFEIIFVNDGSEDATFEKLEEIFRNNTNVSCVVDLARNSGQAAALSAGIAEARGQNFVFIDSDLQLDPEDLPTLIQKFDEGFDMVTGYRRDRSDSFSRIIFSRMAHLILRRAARTKLRDFGCTYKVFRGQLIRPFDFGPHKRVNMPEIIARIGKIAEIGVTHHPRKYGKSGWTFSALLDLLVENFVNTADRLFQMLALTNLGLAGLLILRIVADFFFEFSVLDEVSNGLLLNAIVILGLLNFGIQTLNGEVIIRSFRRLQRSPFYLIRTRHRRGGSNI